MRDRRMRLVRAGAVSAAAAAFALTGPAVAAPGQLDTSFGSGGTSWMSFRACDCASTFRVAPDNKIVVLGPSQVTRLTADGQLDATFGRGGQTALNMTPKALLVDHAGRVVVAGATNGVFQVRRWTKAGTTDAVFDATAESALATHVFKGRKTYTYNPVAVAEQTVGGVSRYLVATDNVTALRLDESGQVDQTFGTSGFAVGDAKAIYQTASFALNHRDGSFAFGGQTRFGSGIARFTSNGQAVTSFGSNGVADLRPAGGTARIAFGPDGALYAGRWTSGGIAVVRLRVDGSSDPTFGTNGLAVATFPAVAASNDRSDTLTKLLVQGDGKLVVAAYAFYSVQNRRYFLQNFELARLLPTGSLDTTFGSSGTVLGNYGDASDMTFQGSRVLISGDLKTGCVAEEDGECIVSNYPPPGTRLGMRIARYNLN